MNKKTIVLLSAFAIILLIGTALLVGKTMNTIKASKPTSEPSKPIVQEENTPQQTAQITIDYLSEDEEYIIMLDNKEITINKMDITPDVDTSKLGTTKYSLDIGGAKVELNIEIVDNSPEIIELELNHDVTIEVSQNATEKEIERTVVRKLFDLNIDQKINFELDYSNTDVSQVGQTTVKVKANLVEDENTKSTFDVKLEVVKIAENDEPRPEREPKPETETKPEPKPETKPEPKPEPETKLEPKPEPKPENLTQAPVDVNKLPSGSELVKAVPKTYISTTNTYEGYYEYKYDLNLSEKAYITEFVMNYDLETKQGVININGKDSYGTNLFYEYSFPSGRESYIWVKPNLTPEEDRVLKDLALQIKDAFGF